MSDKLTAAQAAALALQDKNLAKLLRKMTQPKPIKPR